MVMLRPHHPLDAARAGYPEWRAWRLETVAGPTGNLSLIETRWLPDGDETTLEDALAGHPATVVATPLQRRNLDTGEPERGIRLWDAASPAIRAFETITAFPFNPDWVIEAEFTPVSTAAHGAVRAHPGQRGHPRPGRSRRHHLHPRRGRLFAERLRRRRHPASRLRRREQRRRRSAGHLRSPAASCSFSEPATTRLGSCSTSTAHSFRPAASPDSTTARCRPGTTGSGSSSTQARNGSSSATATTCTDLSRDSRRRSSPPVSTTAQASIPSFLRRLATCPVALTLYSGRRTEPSGSTTNVERSTPVTVLP